MNEFTKGPWSTTPTSSHVYVNNDENAPCGVVCKMANQYDVLQWVCGPASIENSTNAQLIASAGTAATKAAEMGYDAVKTIEALPELIKALDLYLTDCEIERLEYNDDTYSIARAALTKSRGEAGNSND